MCPGVAHLRGLGSNACAANSHGDTGANGTATTYPNR
jgi:hypothetical protein